MFMIIAFISSKYIASCISKCSCLNFNHIYTTEIYAIRFRKSYNLMSHKSYGKLSAID